MMTDITATEPDAFIAPQNGSANNHWYFVEKRLLDLALSAIALLILSPVMLLIALLIKLDSPGPVFFTQERVGSRRRFARGKHIWEICTFRCYKFRSMAQNADESIHQEQVRAFVAGQINVEDQATATVKLTNDPRITRVGHWIRKLSLDELPQLFNVLNGTMSLIGPRPVPIYEFEEYQPYHHERLAALPGITGMWQVYGRGRVTFDAMMDFDISYVRRQSFWLDLKLLALTIPAVLRGQGAE